MKQFVIFGDTVFAERIYKYIQNENIHKVLCFTNENKFRVKEKIDNIDVVPFEHLNELYNKEDFEILVCIGYANMNMLREKIYTICKNAGYKIGSWISSTVISYTDCIAEGCIIMPNCYIGPGCNIGVGNIFGACVKLSHDNKIGNFNFVSTSSTFGGNAVVCNNCFIGLNCTIKSSIKIADLSLIGAASNVLKNTINKGVYVGNPAHRLNDKNSLETKI